MEVPKQHTKQSRAIKVPIGKSYSNLEDVARRLSDVTLNHSDRHYLQRTHSISCQDFDGINNNNSSNNNNRFFNPDTFLGSYQSDISSGSTTPSSSYGSSHTDNEDYSYIQSSSCPLPSTYRTELPRLLIKEPLSKEVKWPSVSTPNSPTWREQTFFSDQVKNELETMHISPLASPQREQFSLKEPTVGDDPDSSMPEIPSFRRIQSFVGRTKGFELCDPDVSEGAVKNSSFPDLDSPPPVDIKFTMEFPDTPVWAVKHEKKPNISDSLDTESKVPSISPLPSIIKSVDQIEPLLLNDEEDQEDASLFTFPLDDIDIYPKVKLETETKETPEVPVEVQHANFSPSLLYSDDVPPPLPLPALVDRELPKEAPSTTVKEEEAPLPYGSPLAILSRSPQEPYPDPTNDDVIPFGAYTRAQRKAKIARFREKKKRMNYGKKIMYACRKEFADSRPRVGGRFVKISDSSSSPSLSSIPRRASSPESLSLSTSTSLPIPVPSSTKRQSLTQQQSQQRPPARPLSSSFIPHSPPLNSLRPRNNSNNISFSFSDSLLP